MSKKTKRIMILTLVFFLLLTIILPIFAEEKKPFSDEAYYTNLCQGYSYNDNASTCEDYKKYLANKVEDDKNSLKDLNFQIGEMKDNLKKYSEELDSFAGKVEALNVRIKSIEMSISSAAKEIVLIEGRIVEREEVIAVQEAKVMKYISSSQSQTRVNVNVEFIMGAKDFSEIIMRMEGLKRIKSYNDDIIAALQIEKQKLEDDKLAMVNRKAEMENSKQILAIEVENVKIAEARAKALFIEFEKQADAIEKQAAQVNHKIKLSNDQMANVKGIPTSNGLIHPLSGSSFANSGWGFKYRGSYRNGHHHTGADYTTGRQRVPVKAPADGVIAIVNNSGCGDGSTYDGCGGGWGNWVVMVVSVKGQAYALAFAHLTAGTIRVSPGQVVRAGEVLGNVGTSGLSTGIHLHAEAYKLNASSIEEAMDGWAGDRYFGASTRYCYTGAGAPCKVDAPLIYGDRKETPGYYN